MTPMPLDTTAEPPVENKIDLGLGGHNARDQPEGEDDGTRLDAAHAPLVLAALLLERPQDGDLLYGQWHLWNYHQDVIKILDRSREHFTITSHKIAAAQITKEWEKIWLDTSVAEPGAADTSAQTASQLDETEKETKSEQTPANFAG